MEREKESVRWRGKNNKILNAKVTVTVHICTVKTSTLVDAKSCKMQKTLHFTHFDQKKHPH